MTREELIEVMAQGICAGQGMYWEDHPLEHEAFKHDAAAALSAIEAAGVRLIYTSKAQVQLIDSGERTSYTIISW